MKKKAVILLSGGLDSLTVTAIAQNENYDLYGISFDYGQRHDIEIEMAKNIAKKYNFIDHKIIKIDTGIFQNSALTDKNIDVPKGGEDLGEENNIPITYVPARNIIFLSYALSYAESSDINNIFIGVNVVDYSGYPDCRPEFIANFENMANSGTAFALKKPFKIHTPLIKLSKEEIIDIGIKLSVNYANSHSCYDPIYYNEQYYACGNCDSCILRLEGFKNNNSKDPYPYYEKN
ncbi:7-cyano-7-deazaguanine synthase QueC [Rickettsiales bacterium]|nr:7-cyano-7-deazaguanine synthase QueC [Rickettsiales bacterium]MDB2550246.1 7-cyano-7-deazaguanine synthase QueC [Rickettsiales bacterium]